MLTLPLKFSGIKNSSGGTVFICFQMNSNDGIVKIGKIVQNIFFFDCCSTNPNNYQKM
jgi:hypothetical protein